MGQYKNQELVHSKKKNCQKNKKTSNQMGDDIANGLISKIYKELIQLNTKQTIQLKMARGPEQMSLTQRHRNGQEINEKIFDFSRY